MKCRSSSVVVVTAGTLMLLQLYHLTVPFLKSGTKTTVIILQALGISYQIASINFYFESEMNWTSIFSSIDQTIMICLVLISAWYCSYRENQPEKCEIEPKNNILLD